VNSSENVNPAAWADLMTKMRDGILSALDSAISLRDDEVKRSESQKQMPGWNFCTFFILKVSRVDASSMACLMFPVHFERKVWHHLSKVWAFSMTP
jgi:hypothetical protein